MISALDATAVSGQLEACSERRVLFGVQPPLGADPVVINDEASLRRALYEEDGTPRPLASQIMLALADPAADHLPPTIAAVIPMYKGVSETAEDYAQVNKLHKPHL